MRAKAQATVAKQKAEQKKRSRIAANNRRRARRCKCGDCRVCKTRQWREEHPENVKTWNRTKYLKAKEMRREPYVWPEPQESMRTMFPNYYAELYSILRICGLT